MGRLGQFFGQREKGPRPEPEGYMIDRYTKTVLTVIALMLTIIVARDIPFISKALAQNGWYDGDTIPVTIRGIDECSSCRWESLPVKID
jgi:hypothetical protein